MWIIIIFMTCLEMSLNTTLVFGFASSLHQENMKKQYTMHTESKNISTAHNKDLSITVIYDNNSYQAGLETGWGFSCLLQGTGKTVLFDTGGDGSKLLANMAKLGINPKEIDMVVLSHIHGDHVGGLPSFLEKNPNVTVFVPKSFPGDFKREIKNYGAHLIEVRETMRICENIYSTGELGTLIKEQSLIVKTNRGLIVITGCAHPGIVKVVRKARDVGQGDILFVMGGYHLGSKNQVEIRNIISDLKKLGVLYVGPCHCTGENARQLFQKEYSKKFIHVGVGKRIYREDLK